MKIGWIIPGVGIFGSVREIVETSNVLCDHGHQITIYNPGGYKIAWTEYKGQVAKCIDVTKDENDIVILVATPDEMYYTELFKGANAKTKIFCFMGLHIKDLQSNRFIKEILSKYVVMADSKPQIEMLRGYATNIIESPIGGYNHKMFRIQDDVLRNKPLWSGDPRPRKGGADSSNLLSECGFTSTSFNTYFGQGYSQEYLARFLNQGRVFVDMHQHGGWCNPVLEAMACGCAIVCSDVYCNQEFAIDQKTAVKVSLPNQRQKALTAIKKFMYDDLYYQEYRENIQSFIQQFRYDIRATNFEKELMSKYGS